MSLISLGTCFILLVFWLSVENLVILAFLLMPPDTLPIPLVLVLGLTGARDTINRKQVKQKRLLCNVPASDNCA